MLLTVFCAFIRCYAFLSLFRAVRAYLGQSTLLALSLAVALPVIQQRPALSGPSTAQLDALSVLSLALYEGLVGILTAVPAALGFEAIAMMGRLVDVSRGELVGEQLNPQLDARLSPLENISILALLMFACSSGSLHLALLPLYASFNSAAPASFVGSLDLSGLLGMSGALSLISLSAKCLCMGVLYAGPVIVVCFFFDVAAIVLTRALVRVNMCFELLPAKLMLGVIVLVLSVLADSIRLDGLWSDIWTTQRGIQGVKPVTEVMP